MTTNKPWPASFPASTAKLNKGDVITDTGANLAALDKTKHKIVACSSTGSGFTLDHAYLFKEDGSGSLDLNSINNHTHTSTAGDGGGVLSIFSWNNTFCTLLLSRVNDLDKANWIQTVTSTGVITNDTDGTTGERSIKLDSGATSGATATINYPHLKLNFANSFLYSTKLRFGTASSLAFHSGVGADDTSAADSNTIKCQAELCTTTNNNFWLRTANGSANSASDIGIAFSTNRVAIDIEHSPGNTTTYMYIGGTTLTKTTNIPTSGATADANLIKHSLKNNTAASRTMFCYPARLHYYISDTWGH